MSFFDKFTGVSVSKLTGPSKLIFGTVIMLSGSILAAQDLLFLA